MNAVIILFILGIVLLGLEVFTPGAVLGILGGIAMLIGIVVAFQISGTTSGVIAIVAAVTLLSLTLYLEFVVIPKTALGRIFTIRPTASLSGSQDVSSSCALIGKTGIAETILSPAGYVVINGVRYEVLSQSGLVSKGSSIQVLGSDGPRLIVSSTNISL